MSGCKHKCKGCHNAGTWDFNAGVPLSQQIIDRIQDGINKRPFVNGITISGGDPVYSYSEVSNLISILDLNGGDVWLYTGFTFEELTVEPYIDLLKKIDVLIDGPYIEELRDITLAFRGSSNQRIIDVKKSLATGNVVLWQPN